MSTCPPLARDRLIGLADASKNLVKVMEEKKAIPKRMPRRCCKNLARIADTIGRMLDVDIFPWVASKATPTEEERHRALTIVADRLCGAVSDPIIRNAQEKRQLAMIAEYLEKRGYRQHAHPAGVPLDQMEPGTFAFRMIVVVGSQLKVNIPIDVVIQRKMPKPGRLPILIEAKSAGDFTNTNKRRKEEAVKIAQLAAGLRQGRGIHPLPLRLLPQRLSWLRGRRGHRLDMGTPDQRPGPAGDMTVLDAEAKRQAIQERLDAARSAAERNRLGQFATPPQLALDIARYALRRWQDRAEAASFLDPAIGSGSFYSALRQTFPAQAIADACGVEIDPRFADAARELMGRLGPARDPGRFHDARCRTGSTI